MGSRKSRRSACDLCRLYKLRCDRDERHGKSCGRCNAANQPCKITLGRPLQAPSNSTQEHENVANDTEMAIANTMAPQPRLESSSLSSQHGTSSVPVSGVGVSAPKPLCTSTTAGPLTNATESVACENNSPIFSDHQNHTDYSNMDFSMPVASFDSGDFSFLFPDAQLDLGNLAAAETSDNNNLEPPSTSGATSLKPWGLSHHNAFSGSYRSKDDHELPAIDSKSLTQLSLEIIEDYELLRTSSPLKGQPANVPHHCSSTEQHRPFNRMLNQASQLWDIIESMSASATTEGAGNSSTSVAQNSLPKRIDQVLIMTLITTYSHLMRNCRGIFIRLLFALQSDASAKLILPSLQFGTFQLSNSLPIQVKVLIDITSGLLLRITNALGINPAGVTAGPPPSAMQNGSETRLPFLMDPTAVSLRDTILSQEHDLPENEEHMSLHGIMVDILHVVDQKFS
ncbi:hypothetical protein PG984_014846 [Apiospora sp. TS-2023a]